MNPLFWIDFYKAGHVSQYPPGTTKVISNWTPRTSRIPGSDKVVFFGLQHFIREVLFAEWNLDFFYTNLDYLLTEYREVIRATLGVENPKTDHIEALHELGYLPLEIYAIPEGFSVGLGQPMFIITNTVDHAYWLPNYFETIMSNMLWKCCTSATTAKRYREVFLKWAKAAGETDFSFIDWQGHDFSMRGMSGRDDAILSGMGHLLSFSGTDTLPAIIAAHESYDAPYSCGGSVAATEHSVMCAYGQGDELETFRHLIEDVYPKGIISIVSDTWDLWKVLTDYVPALKDKILARDGKLVIRPDSGDPVEIICGRKASAGSTTTPAEEGTLRLLAHALGTTDRENMLPMINKGGAIYGDSITLERADQILDRIVNELKISPYNMVFGIGSFTYEYVTRDTYGFAMKATAVVRNGKMYDIFKKPVTDNGGKNSHRGIPVVYRTEDSTEEKPEYFVVQGGTLEQLANCALELVFKDGELLIEHTFDQIRKRVRA